MASLELFEQDQLLARLPEKIHYLHHRLTALRDCAQVGDVRFCGMIGAVELVKEKKSREPYPWEDRVGGKVCNEARKHGLFLRPLGNVVVVFPPLSISLEELVFLMDGIEQSIRAVTETG